MEYNINLLSNTTYAQRRMTYVCDGNDGRSYLVLNDYSTWIPVRHVKHEPDENSIFCFKLENFLGGLKHHEYIYIL